MAEWMDPAVEAVARTEMEREDKGGGDELRWSHLVVVHVPSD